MLNLNPHPLAIPSASHERLADVLAFPARKAEDRAASAAPPYRARIGYGFAPWDWFRCHVLSRQDSRVQCAQRRMFLQCQYCGRESGGWTVDKRATN